MASKFSKALSVQSDGPKQPAVCGRCRWVFAGGDRTQINIPGTNIVRCSDCFEAELFATGRHTKSGTEAADLYRQGIATRTV